jgi:hypothetical protein
MSYKHLMQCAWVLFAICWAKGLLILLAVMSFHGPAVLEEFWSLLPGQHAGGFNVIELHIPPITQNNI